MNAPRTAALGFDVDHLVPATGAGALAEAVRAALGEVTTYDLRVQAAQEMVVVTCGGWVERGGRYHPGLHRTDGPARWWVSTCGRFWGASWCHHGRAHRADGPAELYCDRPPAYFFQLRALVEPGLRPDDGTQVAHRYFQEMTAAGAAPTRALAWLRVASYLGTGPAREMSQAGGDPAPVLAALEAGSREPRALAALAARRAPASWALRG